MVRPLLGAGSMLPRFSCVAGQRVRLVRRAIVVLFMFSMSLAATRARADVIPQAVELPQLLTLEEALQIFRVRGLDLLIAESSVASAEAEIHIAGAVPNPSLSLTYGRVIGSYDPNFVDNGKPCDGCSSNTYGIGISDQSAIVDSLSGKRTLRVRVARNAFAAARLARADAQRTLEYQIKQSYAQIVLARRALDFAIETQATWTSTLDFVRATEAAGKTDPGSTARVDTQKLEADQGVDTAAQTLRQARVALAFLLGVRGRIPDFDVEKDIINFAVPSLLDTASEESLVRSAVEHRPDLRALSFQRARAESAIALARRQRFPDIALSVNYQQTGNGQSVIQPPTLTFGLSAPIPVFYQQQGEIRKAEADYNTQSLQHAKATAQVISDVATAYSAFIVSRRLVGRMEAALLASSAEARRVTNDQYHAGKVKLIDLLDAQRTFISTRIEYLQHLTNYWTAVYQLEQAVGMELRK